MKMFKILNVLIIPALFAATVSARAEVKNERALFAFLKVKAAMEQQFLSAAKTVIEKSRKESGCLVYTLHESEQDPQQFVFYELYKSDTDLQAHRKSKHVVDFLNTINPILVPNGFILNEYVLK
jgi:quinol monooxygenase YgiN